MLNLIAPSHIQYNGLDLVPSLIFHVCLIITTLSPTVYATTENPLFRQPLNLQSVPPYCTPSPSFYSPNYYNP